VVLAEAVADSVAVEAVADSVAVDEERNTNFCLSYTQIKNSRKGVFDF